MLSVTILVSSHLPFIGTGLDGSLCFAGMCCAHGSIKHVHARILSTVNIVYDCGIMSAALVIKFILICNYVLHTQIRSANSHL